MTLTENDHLGDWSPEKNCCWRLTFRHPLRKPILQSSLKMTFTHIVETCTYCRNVSRPQQFFSGLQLPMWSFSIRVCYSWIQTTFLKYKRLKQRQLSCSVIFFSNHFKIWNKLPAKREKILSGILNVSQAKSFLLGNCKVRDMIDDFNTCIWIADWKDCVWSCQF